MRNRTLTLSLIIGAAFTIPSLAMAAPTKEPIPATVMTAAADRTLQAENSESDIPESAISESTEGERASAHSSAVEISETKTFTRSRVSTNNQQAIQVAAADVETLQNSQQDMADLAEDVQSSQEDLQESDVNMQELQEVM